MNKKELEKILNMVNGLASELGRKTAGMVELEEWTRDQLPKTKEWPFLYFNYKLPATVTVIDCCRCNRAIWHDQASFCLDAGPAVKDPKERYNRFCVACATPEEKTHKGLAEYDPSINRSKADIVLAAINDFPGITENQLLEKCKIGLVRLKAIVGRLVEENRIGVTIGAKRAKLHFIKNAPMITVAVLN